MGNSMGPFQSISDVKMVTLRLRIIPIGIFVHLLALSALANPVVIPTPTEQAIEFHNLSNIAWGINETLTLLLAVVFLIFGLGTRMRTSNKFLKLGKYLTFVILATIFFILNWLIQIPLERIRTTTRNQLENNPSVPILQWIFNQFLESLPLIIFAILAALFVYWLVNKSPRKWWLWATGVFSFLFLVFLVIEPLQ